MARIDEFLQSALDFSSRQTRGGFGLACCYAYLGWLSALSAGPSLAEFGAIMMLCFTCYAWARFAAGKLEISAKTVFFWATVFRLIGCWGNPIFEDDFFRYLWDGYRFAADGTPYGPLRKPFSATQAYLPYSSLSSARSIIRTFQPSMALPSNIFLR
ncbi:MAG: hypothetical protein ACU836_03165 [Gammaproteobacteria bacterium]